MKKSIILIVLLGVSNLTWAGLYLEAGIEGGGETFATVEGDSDYFSYEDDLRIGGGVKLAVGWQTMLGTEQRDSLSLAVGYLFDKISADNGDAEYDTRTLDAIYQRHYQHHRFGGGLTYHLGPEYSDDVDGFASTDLEFDDELGVLLQYGYAFTPNIQLNARYTFIEYSLNGSNVDADSFGIIVSGGFF